MPPPWQLWMFAVLVIAWILLFMLPPIYGAVVLSERVGTLGKVGIAATFGLIYMPAMLWASLWAVTRWSQWAGVS